MIDDKMLAELEQRKREMAVAVGNLAGCDLNEQVEIIRNARRYLALRDAAKTQEGRIKVQAIFWHMGSRKDIDAAADRLLEGGE